MRLTWKDGLAAAFVAAAAVLYAVWLAGAGMSGTSTRVLGALVFGLGFAACTTNSSEMADVYGAAPRKRRVPMPYVVTASLIGMVALVAGVITLVTADEAMLATLVVAMIVLLVMSTVRHAVADVMQGHERHIQEPAHRAA